MDQYQKIIETIFDNKNEIITKKNIQSEKKQIKYVIDMLNTGQLRVSEKINNQWITHQWLKKAILLNFYFNKNKIIKNDTQSYFDKIPLKYQRYTEEQFQQEQVRIVPQATVRHGAFIAKNTILMPSYINIGAYIDQNTMIDTWATIGSCAQIGKNVHISGGVGIGGVLEPLQNNPTIIEDNCFIGARSEIVEGVIIEEGSVISMGVFIGQSTKIYDREKNKIFYGKIPKNSVVVSGTLPSKTGLCNLYCAVIVKTVDNKTLKKVELNQLLREIQ
ncbi:2,3,4,5-tetrahydropyridine-2,6-dicarboxylate N-succinyltransferase [Buchnera aphidicola (Eriosoma grossulariae)]|uniref:2,3,4,5-tetrahydropyridine-2,6-dicarboxylate N-succinyltransferase n=1 Tax=Buchnera aphidicola TaxID=9 RepID=UPI0034648998